MSVNNASQLSTSDKSTDPKQILQIEKKKTKVLKGALKEMKKERAVVDSELERAKDQILQLNTQLQDKVRNFSPARVTSLSLSLSSLLNKLIPTMIYLHVVVFLWPVGEKIL